MQRTKMFTREFNIDTSKIGSSTEQLMDYIKSEIDTIIGEVVEEAKVSNLKVIDYKVAKPVPKFSKSGLSFLVELDVTYETVDNE